MKIKKNETYGDFLKRIRTNAKLTQLQFCQLTGFCKTSVSMWENNRSQPSLPSQRHIDDFAKTVKERNR